MSFFKASIRAFWDLFTQRIFYRCATISYFSLMLIFPLLTVVTFALSYLPVQTDVSVKVIEKYFPGVSAGYVKVIEHLAVNRVSYGVISIFLAFLFASNLFIVISNSLAEVTETQQESWKHQLFRQFLSIPLFFVIIILVYVIGAVISIGLKLIDSIEFFQRLTLSVRQYLKVTQVINFSSVFLFALFLYMFLMPGKKKGRVKQILSVSLLVTVLFLIVKSVFASVFVFIIRLNPLYGAFSSILGFLLWIYVSSAVLLYGGRILYYLGNGGKVS